MTSSHAFADGTEHSLDTYINRELSLLEFNRRVLAQAKILNILYLSVLIF